MHKKFRSIGVMFAGFCVAAGVALASQVTFPSTVPFVSNTPIRAAEVNATFAAVKTAVDDNNTRLTAGEASLAGLAARVAALEDQLAAGSHLYAEQGGTDANASVDDAWLDVPGVNIPLTLAAPRNVRYQMAGRLYNYGAGAGTFTQCGVRIVKTTANDPLFGVVPVTAGDWSGMLAGDSTDPDNAHQVELAGMVNLPAGTYNFKIQVVRAAKAGNSGNCSFFRWPFSKVRFFIDLAP